MEYNVALHFLALFLLLSDGASARSLPFNVSSEGSGEMVTEVAVPRFPTQSPIRMAPTSSLSASAQNEPSIFSQVASFLQENLLLTIVLSSLVAVVVFLLCCASVMSQRRKANAYYPSSFPAQNYVDERDKSGGTRMFSEVPERQPDSQGAEPVDSTKKLQADIVNAAKNLRTPTKTPAAEPEGKNPETEPEGVKEQPGKKATKMVGEENCTPPEQHKISKPQNEDTAAPPQESVCMTEGDKMQEEHALKQEADQDEYTCGQKVSGGQQEVKTTQEKEVILPAPQTIVAETAAF